MQDTQEIISALNRSGRRLTKSHQRIAEYMCAHYDRVRPMTAARLAGEVGVSESTVVRFASALGYEGYPELIRALHEVMRHHLTGLERMEMTAAQTEEDVLDLVLKSDAANLKATLEGIDREEYNRVVSMILSSHTIYVMGLRSASPLAMFMGYYLHYIFDDVRLVSSGSTDVFEEISKIRNGDVLIGISFPRYSTRTLDAMAFAKRLGAQVVAITDGPMSPLCSIADSTLLAQTDLASFVDSLSAPLSLINALLVSLGLHRRDALSQHLKQLESIQARYQVYSQEDRHA
ncbi:MAG: MurR/RpiR family transcriptional regulator [Clostridia bacterium]|nr:MurR/RpiR family transcriptional regulator [Clostridia bacterium]